MAIILKYNEFIKENVNYDFFININKKVAEEKNIQTHGDYIVLYHGTSLKNHNAILKSNKLKSGTWFSEDFEVAKKYGTMTTNGKSVVDMCLIYMGAIMYNGYFSSQCDLYYYEGKYSPKEFLKYY